MEIHRDNWGKQAVHSTEPGWVRKPPGAHVQYRTKQWPPEDHWGINSVQNDLSKLADLMFE